MDTSQRIFRPPSGPESVALLGKGLLENRFDHVAYRHLDHSILDRRNPQRPQFLAPQLRYPYPLDRLWLVFPAAELRLQAG